MIQGNQDNQNTVFVPENVRRRINLMPYSELRQSFNLLKQELTSRSEVEGERPIDDKTSLIKRRLSDGSSFQLIVRKTYRNPGWLIHILEFRSPEQVAEDEFKRLLPPPPKFEILRNIPIIWSRANAYARFTLFLILVLSLIFTSILKDLKKPELNQPQKSSLEKVEYKRF